MVKAIRRFRPLALERFESRQLLTAAWSVAFDDPGASHASSYEAIRATVVAAGQEWNRFLPAGSGSIEITVRFSDLPSTILATGASATTVFVQNAGALEIRESSVAYEIRTGRDPNGASADAIITLNNLALSQDLWFDPTPDNRFDESVPAGRYDAYSVILHEIAHTLGFNGFRDPATGQLSGSIASTFDRYVTLTNGMPYFIGSAAEAAYGGQPLPLAAGSLYHLGNGSWPEDLMSGAGIPAGGREFITQLDAAILTDIGLPIAAQPVNTAPYVSNIPNQTMDEDGFLNVSYAVGDLDTRGDFLSVSIVSSNPTLFPNWGLSGPHGYGPQSLQLHPALDANGSATITISASDGTFTTTRSFQVTVNPVYDAPTIHSTNEIDMFEDIAYDTYVQASSVEVSASSLVVTASCSPSSLFGPNGITISGTGELRTVHLVPAKDQNTQDGWWGPDGGWRGFAELRFVVSDGIGTSTWVTRVYVANTADTPVIDPIEDQYLATNENSSVPFKITNDSIYSAYLTVDSSDWNLVWAGVPGPLNDQRILLTAQPGAQGLATITFRASNDVGEAVETFHVRVADNPFPWHHAAQPCDVDGDGFVAPIDALLVINRLNTIGAGVLPWPAAGQLPSTYYDVSRDNKIAPGDALQVINYIDSHILAAPKPLVAEGEGGAATAGDSGFTRYLSDLNAAAVDYLLRLGSDGDFQLPGPRVGGTQRRSSAG